MQQQLRSSLTTSSIKKEKPLRSRMANLLWTLVLLIGAPHRGTAQASLDCSALLTHGLRNVYDATSEEGSVSLKWHNNCGKEWHSASDEILGQAEVEIFGIAGGGASFGRKEREERLRQWCDQNSDFAKSHRKAHQQAQVIYGGAVQAWTRCNELLSKDVRMVADITPDGKTAEITLSYFGPTRSGVKLAGIKAENFTCEALVPTDSGYKPFASGDDVEINQEAVVVNCLRGEPQTMTREGEQFEVLPRGVITVRTASFPLQLYFEEKLDPALPKAEAVRLSEAIDRILPVGSVVAFAGALDRDVTLPSGWLPCDGRALPRDQFQELFDVIQTTYGVGLDHEERKSGDFNLPDYRGYFLRGLESATAVSPLPEPPRDPERRLANQGIGSVEPASVGPHSHGASIEPTGSILARGAQSGETSPGWPGGHNGGYWTQVGITSVKVAEHPGVEARPLNRAVNYIIRVR